VDAEKNKRKKTTKKQIIFRVINIVAVVGLGAFLIYLYFRLGQLTLQELKETLLNMYKPTLILALAIMLLSNLFRAYRKNILVGSDRIGMGDMFLIAMIRNAFNMVLPARTGELSYVYILTHRFQFPLEIGISTLMVALIFDLVIVFTLIIVAVIIVGISSFSIPPVSVVLISIILLGTSLLILLYLSKIIDFILIVYRKILKGLKVRENRFIYRIYIKLFDINNNLKIIRGRKIYWKVYLSSIAIRVLKFTSYYLIIHAILMPLGYSFSSLNYWVILLATAAAEISAVLPTHAFAGFGTYEGAFALAAIPLGFVKGSEITVGFAYHIVVLLFTVILGIISMIIISMPFYRVKISELEEKGE
jgi:glycosyltransferase 2 family protein